MTVFLAIASYLSWCYLHFDFRYGPMVLHQSYSKACKGGNTVSMLESIHFMKFQLKWQRTEHIRGVLFQMEFRWYHWGLVHYILFSPLASQMNGCPWRQGRWKWIMYSRNPVLIILLLCFNEYLILYSSRRTYSRSSARIYPGKYRTCVAFRKQ